MTAAPRYDEWDDLVTLIQRYARRKYGQSATAITIHLMYSEGHREPLPQLHHPPPARPEPKPLAGWASGEEPKHLSDFQQVYWPGLGVFRFSPKQATVVEQLWDAKFNCDSPDVDQAALLAAADSDCPRLVDLFRGKGKSHPAWGKLIVPGFSPATFRLPDLASGDDE